MTGRLQQACNSSNSCYRQLPGHGQRQLRRLPRTVERLMPALASGEIRLKKQRQERSVLTLAVEVEEEEEGVL